MKTQNIFGMKISDFEKSLKLKNILCIIYLFVTIALNIVLTFLRNEKNHYFLLISNILLDILCFIFILTYIGCYYKPKTNILKLYKENKVIVEGEISEVSAKTFRYMHLDCYVIIINGHKYYLPENNFIQLKANDKVKISTAYEIILEVFSYEI